MSAYIDALGNVQAPEKLLRNIAKIRDKVGGQYLDDVIRSVGADVLGKSLGVVGAIANAWEVGVGIGGAISGAVNPYENPYRELSEEGDLPLGFGVAEIGWEIGAGIRLGIEDLLNPDDESFIPIPVPLPEEEIKENENTGSDSASSTENNSITANYEGLNSSSFPSAIELEELPFNEIKTPGDQIESSSNYVTSDATQGWVLVEIIAEAKGHLRQYGEYLYYSLKGRAWSDINRSTTVNGFKSDGTKPVEKIWFYNINSIVYESIVSVRVNSPATSPDAPQIQIPEYTIRLRKGILAEKWVAYDPYYPNTPYSPNQIIREFGVPFHNTYLFSESGWVDNKSLLGRYLHIIKVSQITVGYLINEKPWPEKIEKPQAIPLSNDQEKRVSVKCRALDAVAALNSRITAIEIALEQANSKLGDEAITSVTLSNEDGTTEEIDLDGLSGATGYLIEQFHSQDTSGIDEIKDILGAKIEQITVGGEPIDLDGIGGALRLSLPLSLDTNVKLGAQITELQISDDDPIPVDGIGGLSALAAKSAIANNQGINEANEKLGPLIEEVEVYNPDTGTLEKVAVAGGIAGATAVVASNIGKFRDKFDQVRKWLMSGRILEILTFASSLHNAHQLSSSVVDLIIQSVENVLNIVGVEDEEGNPIDIREQLGKQVEDLMVSVFGTEAYETAIVRWHKYNRIYQSASNILGNISSMFNALGDTTEIIGSYVGTIGNALRRYRVVSDNAYQWMAEKMSAKNRWQRGLNRLTEGLETAEELTSNLEQVTANVLEVTELSQEIVVESAELRELLSEGSPKEEDKEFESNQAIKLAQEMAENDSYAPPVTTQDIEDVANIE